MSRDKGLRSIEIVGPESSGKSLLTKALAAKFKTSYAVEFAVDFLTERGGHYTQQDLEEIADRQHQSNLDAIQRGCGEWVFLDTGLLTIKLWSEIKYGSVSPRISTLFEQNFSDYYILCAPDLPWEFHPLREAPSLADRMHIFERHLLELENQGLSYCIIAGEQRLEQAIAFLKEWTT